MYKQHLTNSMEREIELLKNLSAHIEESDLDFRLSEKTRSTIELMQYLSGLGGIMLRWFIVNDLTQEEWEKIRADRKNVTIADFAERLDKQMADIRHYMGMVSEDDMFNKLVELPWKEKMSLGEAIMNCPVKWLASYRMQLFLNLKVNGKHDLATKHAWVIDSAEKSVG